METCWAHCIRCARHTVFFTVLSSDYKSRIVALQMLPLMMHMFFVQCLKSLPTFQPMSLSVLTPHVPLPISNWNILCLEQILCNISRMPRLWNSLSPLHMKADPFGPPQLWVCIIDIPSTSCNGRWWVYDSSSIMLIRLEQLFCWWCWLYIC